MKAQPAVAINEVGTVIRITRDGQTVRAFPDEIPALVQDLVDAHCTITGNLTLDLDRPESPALRNARRESFTAGAFCAALLFITIAALYLANK
jgi:hypothetical protein